MIKRNLHCESQKRIRDGVVGVMAFYLCSQNIYQKYSFFLFFLPLTAFTHLCNSSLQLSSTQMLIYCYSVTFHVIALSLVTSYSSCITVLSFILHFAGFHSPLLLKSFCLLESHHHLPFLILQLHQVITFDLILVPSSIPFFIPPKSEASSFD